MTFSTIPTIPHIHQGFAYKQTLLIGGLPKLCFLYALAGNYTNLNTC